MLNWLIGHAELIAGGVVGLSMVGLIARNALFGWVEAKKKLSDNQSAVGALTTAVSLTWDRNQIERALQLLESIAHSLENQARSTEAIAHSQGILSDSFQQSTQSKLDDLLQRLDNVQAPKHRR